LIKTLFEQEQIASLPYISVNVSPRQFHQSDFIKRLQYILNETKADPGKLCLELTEGIVIENMDDTIEKMLDIKKLGVHFSIDDFGTGYSSLAYLKRLPLNTLKIDQSFVRDVTTNTNDAVIVEAILSMAKHLGFKTIAEGIETKDQVDFLNKSGCHAYQGYYFSKPLPVDEFIHFIENTKS